MTVIRALDALDATVHLLAPSRDGGDLDDEMSDIMAKLSGAVGASRACWSFFGAKQHDHIVQRYITGGDGSVPPMDPKVMAHALRSVPELQRVFENDHGFVVVEARRAGSAFGSLARHSNVDWVAGTASHASGLPRSVLVLAGRGQPPDPAELENSVVSTISEIMRSMLVPSSNGVPDVPGDEFLALAEGLDVGVVLIDETSRALCVNARAAAWLGTSNAALRDTIVKITDWNWWLDPMDVLMAKAVGEPAPAKNPSRPTIVRIRDSSGRILRVVVTMRDVVANAGVGVGRRVATMEELPIEELPVVQQRPGDMGAGVSDTNRELVAVVGRLRSVLADLETYRGTPNVGPAALPEVFGVLTAREREIVTYLLGGVRVATIAQRLYLSPHTVRNHLRSIFRKVGVPSQAELIELARNIR